MTSSKISTPNAITSEFRVSTYVLGGHTLVYSNIHLYYFPSWLSGDLVFMRYVGRNRYPKITRVFPLLASWDCWNFYEKKGGDLFMLTRIALVQHIIINAASLGRLHIITLCGFRKNPFLWVKI